MMMMMGGGIDPGDTTGTGIPPGGDPPPSGGDSCYTIMNYYVNDMYGSVRTGVRGTTVLTRLIEYYPYGAAYSMSGGGSVYTFLGKEDPGVGMLDFGPRYYDATLGRFMAPDPILASPSAYSYGEGNPIMLYDPSGMFVELPTSYSHHPSDEEIEAWIAEGSVVPPPPGTYMVGYGRDARFVQSGYETPQQAAADLSIGSDAHNAYKQRQRIQKMKNDYNKKRADAKRRSDRLQKRKAKRLLIEKSTKQHEQTGGGSRTIAGEGAAGPNTDAIEQVVDLLKSAGNTAAEALQFTSDALDEWSAEVDAMPASGEKIHLDLVVAEAHGAMATVYGAIAVGTSKGIGAKGTGYIGNLTKTGIVLGSGSMAIHHAGKRMHHLGAASMGILEYPLPETLLYDNPGGPQDTHRIKN